jgi:enamine deaminase RidA (YjgF/YER057c/UK114 family)
MEIIQERIFGSISMAREVLSARDSALKAVDLAAHRPVTYIQGQPTWGEGLAGVIIHAVFKEGPTDEVWTIMDGETPCGRGWRRNGATYLVLQNIQCMEKGPARINTAPIQTSRVFERAQNILHGQGAAFPDVVRTWFYLSEILDWYSEFNQVRNARYRQFGIMPGPATEHILLPASTGIGGENPQGSACAMDLLAVLNHGSSDPSIRKMTNPGQTDAIQYGSAFSRAVLVCEASVSVIHVSGTAAIDHAGRSLYPNDIRSQIACTLDHVEALLGQDGARLSDIAAATVFVKRPEDEHVFRKMAEARGLHDFPGVCMVADVCRKELLFEMDAEVVCHHNP